MDPSEGFETTIQTTGGQFPGQVEVLPGSEALAAAQSHLPRLAIWSDGSRLENGRCGAWLAWQEQGGAWKTQGFPLGKGHEVFDAELLGVVQALQVAGKVGDQRPVTILLDSQAAIARLRHTQPGPGQALMTQAHAIAKRLHAQCSQLTIQWVPGHVGVEGNERADQAATENYMGGVIPGGFDLICQFACYTQKYTTCRQQLLYQTKDL